MTLTEKELKWVNEATMARMGLYQYILKLADRKLRGREATKLNSLLDKYSAVCTRIGESA